MHVKPKQRSPGSGTTCATQANATARLGDIRDYTTLVLYSLAKTSQNRWNNLKLSVSVKNVFNCCDFTHLD